MILYLGNKLSRYGNTPTSVETLGQRFSETGIEIITRSSFKQKWLRLPDMLYAIFKHRKKNPLIIIDTYSTSAFWFAFLSAWMCNRLKLNYIPILHGGNLPKRIDRFPHTSGYLFNNSFTNVAVSGYLKQEMNSRNIETEIIPNFIDLDKYPFLLRKNIRPRLLWVRSFHKIYNPEMAVRVFQKLKISYPDSTLSMVGPDKDGSLQKCKTLADKLNLEIHFTGYLEKEQWIAHSSAFDIFINTTHVDNTPVSVMEAMALGMPVITTNVGGIPWIIKHGVSGILVEKNNVDEMTAAITDLIADQEKSAGISLIARNLASQWDWKIVKQKWLELFEKGLKSQVK